MIGLACTHHSPYRKIWWHLLEKQKNILQTHEFVLTYMTCAPLTIQSLCWFARPLFFCVPLQPNSVVHRPVSLALSAEVSSMTEGVNISDDSDQARLLRQAYVELVS